MDKPKNLKQLLRDHRKNRIYLWERIIVRLGWLRHVVEKERNPLLLRLIIELENYRSMESLFTSLIYKRSTKPEDTPSETEQRYQPFERPSNSIQDRLDAGLRATIFKLN